MGSSSRSERASPPAPDGLPAAGDLITIGRVAAPHGVRGELRVRPETDFPQRFADLRDAYLVRGDRVEAVEVTASRPHRGGVLLTIRGVGDATAAGRLRGAALAVPRGALVPLGPDAHYIFEIIGLRARTPDGRPLGTVTAVLRGPAHDVYVVRGEGGEVLVPAVGAVVLRIDRAAGEMVVDLPAGLEGGRRAD